MKVINYMVAPYKEAFAAFAGALIGKEESFVQKMEPFTKTSQYVSFPLELTHPSVSMRVDFAKTQVFIRKGNEERTVSFSAISEVSHEVALLLDVEEGSVARKMMELYFGYRVLKLVWETAQSSDFRRHLGQFQVLSGAVHQFLHQQIV